MEGNTRETPPTTAAF